MKCEKKQQKRGKHVNRKLNYGAISNKTHTLSRVSFTIYSYIIIIYDFIALFCRFAFVVVVVVFLR